MSIAVGRFQARRATTRPLSRTSRLCSFTQRTRVWLAPQNRPRKRTGCPVTMFGSEMIEYLALFPSASSSHHQRSQRQPN